MEKADTQRKNGRTHFLWMFAFTKKEEQFFLCVFSQIFAFFSLCALKILSVFFFVCSPLFAFSFCVPHFLRFGFVFQNSLRFFFYFETQKLSFRFWEPPLRSAPHGFAGSAPLRSGSQKRKIIFVFSKKSQKVKNSEKSCSASFCERKKGRNLCIHRRILLREEFFLEKTLLREEFFLEKNFA